MIKKIIYVNQSINKILLSIKTFDIYFLNKFQKNINAYKRNKKMQKGPLLSEYKHIFNMYSIYQHLCLNDFQSMSLIILKNYVNKTKLNISPKYNTRFKYLLNRHLKEKKYIHKQKTHNIENIKIAIIYIYVLNQINNVFGFYIFIKYFLII
uniref:hypothetical protein n=1 Tax=Hypnea flava TaxID=1524266 RepID=UPI0027DA44B7|nr:hypothetical protein REP59_pgp009 [Hypnea flava]WCH55025.1 hypothetical protein [Hypnea flava]